MMNKNNIIILIACPTQRNNNNSYVKNSVCDACILVTCMNIASYSGLFLTYLVNCFYCFYYCFFFLFVSGLLMDVPQLLLLIQEPLRLLLFLCMMAMH